jgi:translocation and assembly module TamB
MLQRSFRSARGDRADAKLVVGRVAGAPPGRLAPEAPLEFSASGDIPTLQILQPWIGSAAVVSGRAHLDVAARGTVKEANLSGAVLGENLRIDAPRYGIHYTNGRVAVRGGEGRVSIDEVKLSAGDGTFRASGEITGLAPGGDKPVARLTWKAEKFRATNRPDLRLVVGGEGTAVAQNGKITLNGKLAAEEGAVVYTATPDTTLGSDVVVKGWKPPRSARCASTTSRSSSTWRSISAITSRSRVRASKRALPVPCASPPVQAGSSARARSARCAEPTSLSASASTSIAASSCSTDRSTTRDSTSSRCGGISPSRPEWPVTGTVKVPVIQLTSNPPVPDSEKLSWLVLGQAGRRSLVGCGSRGVAGGLVRATRFRRQADFRVGRAVDRPRRHQSQKHRSTRCPAGAPAAENQVIAVGKRLTDRLTLVYEQGLTLATQALRLEYELTRSLTIRAEAGTYGALGLYFRRTFD